MTRYRLSPDAQLDLVDIRDQFYREAGLRASRRLTSEFIDAFRMLARTPGAGHTRVDLVGHRPLLFWPVRDYLILYRARGKRVEIAAIVNGFRDVNIVLNRRGI